LTSAEGTFSLLQLYAHFPGIFDHRPVIAGFVAFPGPRYFQRVDFGCHQAKIVGGGQVLYLQREARLADMTGTQSIAGNAIFVREAVRTMGTFGCRS